MQDLECTDPAQELALDDAEYKAPTWEQEVDKDRESICPERSRA